MCAWTERSASKGGVAVKTTIKGWRVLLLLTKWETSGDGPVNEGNLCDELGLARPRPVCVALERQGLVTFGDWYDEYGHDVHLTEAGRAYVADRQAVA